MSLLKKLYNIVIYIKANLQQTWIFLIINKKKMIRQNNGTY